MVICNTQWIEYLLLYLVSFHNNILHNNILIGNGNQYGLVNTVISSHRSAWRPKQVRQFGQFWNLSPDAQPNQNAAHFCYHQDQQVVHPRRSKTCFELISIPDVRPIFTPVHKSEGDSKWIQPESFYLLALTRIHQSSPRDIYVFTQMLLFHSAKCHIWGWRWVGRWIW